MRRALIVVLLLLAAPAARAQSEAEDAARMRGELLQLRKELREVKARLAHVEQLLASVAPVATDTTRPELSPDLGFVVPGLPRGSFGAESPGELARFLHHYATNSEHDLEQLVAFKGIDFYVPEALWNQAARGLKTVQGLPTRDELELALGPLKGAGVSSQLMGIRPVPELAPKGRDGCLQVWDLDVSVASRTEHYRLTAVRLAGRWCAAHLIFLSAEEEAHDFLEDLVASQHAFHAFRQGRYARSLHELAGARELENNPNIKAAGLSFPIGARLDRIEKEKLADWIGNDLRGRFYRFALTGDEKSGWSASAIPGSGSYWSYTVSVQANADPQKKPEVKRFRASATGETAPDQGKDSRREGEPEGE